MKVGDLVKRSAHLKDGHSKIGIVIEIRRRHFDGEPKVVYVVTLNGKRRRWYTQFLVKL